MSRVPFHVPKLSATSATVKVVQWLKQPGDTVASGEPFVELETDKTALEVEAPVDGVLSAVHADAGDELEAGVLLAEFEERAAVVAAAPAARQAPPPAAPPAIAPSSMRLAVARSVAASRREIPSFWVERWANTEAVHARRAQVAAAGKPPSLTDYLVKAIAHALVQRPVLLTRWVESSDGTPNLVRLGSINVGLVVALDEGMLIPVLAGCDTASLQMLRAARKSAVEAARSGRLGNVGGEASVSLSNLGGAGVDRFEAIVQPGQTAIVAVGRETVRVQPATDGFEAVRGIHLVVSVDHRVVDGAEAARFVAAIAEWIERAGDHDE